MAMPGFGLKRGASSMVMNSTPPGAEASLTVTSDSLGFMNPDSPDDPIQSRGGWQRKDLSNFTPVQTIPLDKHYTRIYTAGNDLLGETIMALTNSHLITIYSVTPKETVDLMSRRTEPTAAGVQKDCFELQKIHEVELINQYFGCFAISPVGSLVLPPLLLTYAVAPMLSNIVFVYQHPEGEKSIPSKISLDDEGATVPFVKITQVQNPYPTTRMAIQGDKNLLACVLGNNSVVVWDLKEGIKYHEHYLLSSYGVHIAWHQSEPYSLMVTQGNGRISFINVCKEICYRTIDTGKTQIYSSDWSLSNSLYVALSWAGGFSVINSAQMNTNLHKTFKSHQSNISKVRFNPWDDQVIATLARTPGVIKLWRQNFSSHIWTHDNLVEDISWVHGQPYLIAVGYQRLFIYDASAC